MNTPTGYMVERDGKITVLPFNELTQEERKMFVGKSHKEIVLEDVDYRVLTKYQKAKL